MRFLYWLARAFRRPPDKTRLAHAGYIVGMVPVYVVALAFVLIPVFVPLYWGSELVQAISRIFGPEWRQWTSAAAFALFELSLVIAVVVSVQSHRRRHPAAS